MPIDISIPVIIPKIGGYIFTWEDTGISINVSRIVVHKTDGRVTGELLGEIKEKDKIIVFLPPTQHNFSSEQTRDRLTKKLLLKYPGLPWEEMINQLSSGIHDRARQGEPVRELWTNAEDVKPPEPLLEPILYRNIPTVIFGDKEACKSTLALYFYFCLVLPWQDNPLELKVPQKSIKTLILDWEAEGEVVQYFGKRIQQGENLPALPILYRRCFMPLADDLERIHYWVENTKAEMLIIDSLGAACGGELNKAEPALKFFSALRELKRGSLIIAHNAKDPETKKKTIFGSVFFQNYSRNIFELVKGEEIEQDSANIALFHRAVNIGRHHKPMSFQLHYNKTGITIARQPFDTAEFIKKITDTQRILETLKHGALKPKEIAKAIESNENVTRVLLSRLHKRGMVTPVEGGWGLATREEIS